MSSTVKSLQEIYARMDQEATNLFKAATSTMTIYKSKIRTLGKMRQLIQDTVTERQFKDWDQQFVCRKPIQLQLLDIERVSIVIFSFF